MFRRSDAIWLLFDTDQPIDASAIRREGSLVVADVARPCLDGLGLVAAMRAWGSETPVLLVSALATPALPPGTAFLGKPFGVNALAAAIDRLLGNPAP